MEPTRENRPRTETGEMVFTVGPKDGDICGCDDRALQAGADYVNRLGGGVLRILPGTYVMRNALYLHSNLTVCGAGEDTVLLKSPSAVTPLRVDADWYEARVAVDDPSGFRSGDGILLRAYSEGRLSNVVQGTVTAVEGHVIGLDTRLLKNFWTGDRATAASLFPLVTAVAGTTDVRVENLVLDGNGAENEEINGNYSGGVFLQQCDRFVFRNVTARSYNGDGFSFQVCDDVRFEHCHAEFNTSRGYHPGSGSQRPVFDGCTARNNEQGIFFCWGVSDGLVERCDCSENQKFGISIGHRDTDNRIVETRIADNGHVGVLFRDPVTDFRGAHRNAIAECEIVDNGGKAYGVGVDVRGLTCDVRIQKNAFVDSGSGKQRIGVRVSAEARDTVIEENRFEGMQKDVEFLETQTKGDGYARAE